MRTKKLDMEWVQEVEKLVKSVEFSEAFHKSRQMLEEINRLIPTTHMRFLKLNLSLAVDLLETCRKQTFRVAQFRRWGG